MKKAIKCLCMSSIFLLIFVGCISKSEIQSNLIVEAIGIDYVESEYLVTLCSINSTKEIETYQGKGATLNQAFEQISLDEGKELLFSSSSSLVLGENIEGDRLKNIFWIFSDSKSYNYEMDVFYSERAEQIVKSDGAQKIGTNITNKVVNESSGYFTVKVKFLELLKEFYESENCFSIPIVKENQKEKSIYFDGAFILKNTKQYMRISSKEFSVLKLLERDEKNYTLTIDNLFSVELIESRVIAKKVNEEIQITVRLKGTLLETKDLVEVDDKTRDQKVQQYVKYVLDKFITDHKLPIIKQVKALGLSQEDLKGYKITVNVYYEEI